MADSQDEKTETIAPPQAADQDRRAALARMGRFAGYTAPVMLGLLGATKARAQTSGSPVAVVF